MSKVILLNGSAHTHGCTATALEEMIKVFDAEGIETELIQLGTKDIRGCVACGNCGEKGRCVFDDLVNEVAPKFEAADGLVVGSPVYYASPNGNIISFMDRLFYSTHFSKHMKVGASVVSCRRGGNTATFDVLNKQTDGVRLTVSTVSTHLTNDEIKKQFDITDALTARLENAPHPSPSAYFARSVAYCIGQNYGDALKDVDAYLAENPNSALGWWHRAVCNARQADYETGAEPQTAQLRLKSVNADFERAESLDKDNAYILYCHGTFLAHRQDYDKAIQYFTRAVALDDRLAEAYFNRGMVYYYKGDKVKGNADLSKAGELGLYSAYSIIKSNSKK